MSTQPGMAWTATAIARMRIRTADGARPWKKDLCCIPLPWVVNRLREGCYFDSRFRATFFRIAHSEGDNRAENPDQPQRPSQLDASGKAGTDFRMVPRPSLTRMQLFCWGPIRFWMDICHSHFLSINRLLLRSWPFWAIQSMILWSFMTGFVSTFIYIQNKPQLRRITMQWTAPCVGPSVPPLLFWLSWLLFSFLVEHPLKGLSLLCYLVFLLELIHLSSLQLRLHSMHCQKIKELSRNHRLK